MKLVSLYVSDKRYKTIEQYILEMVYNQNTILVGDDFFFPLKTIYSVPPSCQSRSMMFKIQKFNCLGFNFCFVTISSAKLPGSSSLNFSEPQFPIWNNGENIITFLIKFCEN